MSFPHQIDAANPNGVLWNHVAKTYPSSTKRVQQGGREFTAIDAYAQIKRATEVFGPVGSGWGWVVTDMKHFGESPHDIVSVTVEIWYHTPSLDSRESPFSSERCSFSSVGCAQVNMQPRGKDYVRTDSDAPKKAVTDAVTKGLSFLGFNADVFFGAFDNNKYVEAMAKEERGQAEKPKKKEKVADAPASVLVPTRGNPAWLEEALGGEGKYSTKTWEWFTGGKPDGGRHKYLRWMYENYKVDRLRKRIQWILAKWYGDESLPETNDGAGHIQEPSV